MFAWEAYEKGTEVHLQADPTKLELLSKEFEQRREKFKQSAKDNVLERYGGQEFLEAPPKQLLLAQTVMNVARNVLALGHNEHFSTIEIASAKGSKNTFEMGALA